MSKQGINLTPLETGALAWSQLNKQRIIRTGDLLKVLAISPKQEANLLTKMSKSGVAIKMMRGLYLLPEITPSQAWTPSEYYLLAILMKEINADYQITGLAAFNFHKLTTQIPNQLTVYNTQLSGRKKIGNVIFNFIKVNKNRLGDTVSFNVKDNSGNTEVFIGSLTRTIVDAIYDYERFATIPEVYSWIMNRKQDRIFIRNLAKSTINFGNISTRRRIGYLLNLLKISPGITNQILKDLPTTNSLIPMIPALPIRGINDRKWGVVVNGEI